VLSCLFCSEVNSFREMFHFVFMTLAIVIFFQDNNLGLVKQVLSSLYKRNIQRLTQTYLTLSLQDIASTVQLNNAKDAEMHVLRMVILFVELFHHRLNLFCCSGNLWGFSFLIPDPRWGNLCHDKSKRWNGQFSWGPWTVQNLWDDTAYRLIYPEVLQPLGLYSFC